MELADKLNAVGAPVPEEDQIILLLSSLTTAYSTLQTALEARVDVDDNLTLEFVHSALLNEEIKMHPLSAHPPSAISSACSASALMGEDTEVICHRCGQPGHIQRGCRNKKKTQERASHAYQCDEEDDLMFTAANSNCEKDVQRWCIDSGATKHMTSHRYLLKNYQPLNPPEKVTLGDGHEIEAVGVGEVKCRILCDDGGSFAVTMKNVLHIPTACANLFSVKAMTRNGYTVTFGQRSCWAKGPNGKVYVLGALKKQLYEMTCEVTRRTESAAMMKTSSNTELNSVSTDVLLQTLKKRFDNGDDLLRSVPVTPVAESSVSSTTIPEPHSDHETHFALQSESVPEHVPDICTDPSTVPVKLRNEKTRKQKTFISKLLAAGIWTIDNS